MRRREKRGSRHSSDGPLTVGPACPAGRPWFWIAVSLAALGLRVVLVLARGSTIYTSDHDVFVRWGIQITDRGLLSVYDEPPPRWNLRERDTRSGAWRIKPRPIDPVCNYPPAAVYLLGVSGYVFRAVSADRLINTTASMLVFTSWSMIGDLLVAAGCAAIAALYHRAWVPRLVYVLMVLAPPLWWDSVIWGQMDTVLLAPCVWMLYALLRQRWLAAGLLWGLALSFKPQAVLLVPVWGYALLTARPAWRTVAGAVVAAATVMILALPFTLHSGWTWARLCYLDPVFQTFADQTTLRAFNLWYLDLLLTNSVDAGALYLGISKSTWGKVLLIAGLAGGLAWTWRRWRKDPRGLIVYAALSLLLFVMLPTKVHDRYLILALPFLVSAATFTRRLWPGLLLLTIVLMAQLSWPLWLPMARGIWSQEQASLSRRYEASVATQPAAVRERLPTLENIVAASEARYQQMLDKTLVTEWLFTLLGLLGAGLCVGGLATWRPPPAMARGRPDVAV